MAQASLNYLNYLNVIGYIINVFFTFFSVPVFGIPDNGELSDKYQTILTPSGWAFAIWGIIFTAEGIFAVVQMIPKFRNDPMVQDGIFIWYFVSCVAQSGWTLAFGYEVIILSLVFMISILVSLVMILVLQDRVQSDGSLLKYWLLRFPFSIHCGWIVSATCLNIGVVAVDAGSSAQMQSNLAIICLVFIVLCSFAATFLPKSPNYAIPGVACWTTLAIAFELNGPADNIANLFGEDIINAFKITSAVLCGFCFLWIVGFATYQLVTRSCGFQNKVEQGDVDGDVDGGEKEGDVTSNFQAVVD